VTQLRIGGIFSNFVVANVTQYVPL